MKKDQFKFDKFVKDICKREEAGKQRVKEHLQGQEELPQRKYNRPSLPSKTTCQEVST